MEVIARIMLTLLVTAALGAVIRTFVTIAARKSWSDEPRTPTMPGVLFVVSARQWQSVLLSIGGLLLIATGLVCVLLAIILGGESAGGGIPGLLIAAAGGTFLWLARRVAGTRLEVASDAIWVCGRSGARRQVRVQEISRLVPMTSNRYGGVVAKDGHHRLFAVTRLMLGYSQLIDYLRSRRPDLTIPDASLPAGRHESSARPAVDQPLDEP